MALWPATRKWWTTVATRWCRSSIPGLPAAEILEAVHHFYDAYYFRPKAAYRILRKAVFDNSKRKRLYKEARTFLKLRSQRHKWVKENRKEETPAPAPAKA